MIALFTNNTMAHGDNDDESTDLKFVHDGYSVSESSRQRISQKRSISQSESESSSETSTSLLQPTSPHSYSNVPSRSGDTPHDYYNGTSHYTTVPYDTVQSKRPSNDSSSSGSTNCSTCGACIRSQQPETPRQAPNRCLTVITIISAVLSLTALSISGLGYLFSSSLEREHTTFREGDYEACIPCAQFPDNGDDDHLKNQLVVKVADTGAQCCARTNGQMSVLMQLIMNQQRKDTVVQTSPQHQNFKFSPVSAHKRLYPWDLSHFDEPKFEDKLHHLKFNPVNDDIREHSRNVVTKNNSLQIEFSGWYLVYSSVYFKPRTDKQCWELRHKTWGHYINRLSARRISTSGTLVHSAHTCCDNCTDDHHTSYTAGVFKLEAGDNIFVQVSGSGLVWFDGDGSYFGLVMLGGRDSASNDEASSSGFIKNTGK